MAGIQIYRSSTSVLRGLVSALLVPFALVASAQTVLVGPGVRNGDFEDGTGTGNRTYAETEFWVNIGTGGTSQLATWTNKFYAGSRSLKPAEGIYRIAAQDTGHALRAGDLFEISYSWLPDYNWSIEDKIAIRLFTTDTDALTGIASTFATLLSGVSTNTSVWMSVTNRAIATPSESGKRLFVAIDTGEGNKTNIGSACVDNFNLTVTRSSNVVESIVHYAPALRNGGFETAVGDITTNWGTGLNVTNCVSQTNLPKITVPHGARMLSIHPYSGAGGLENTGHVVKKGQTFSLAFEWTSGLGWDAVDSIAWRLFTTSNNATNGTVAVIASGSVTGKQREGNEWDTYLALNDGGTISSNNVDKQLWIEIRGISAIDEYAKVDMVRLMVNTPRQLGTLFIVQ